MSLTAPLHIRSLRAPTRILHRGITSAATAASPSTSASSTPIAQKEGEHEPFTHFKITATRSSIGLPQRYKATLETLGIHRRMGTVYMPHSPEAAGKILRVKELVRVENVPASQVKTKKQAREERKAPRGYVVVKRFAEH
ncbi:hypothetical protein FRC02_004687 [Tulasnella sp. 418]|nr:hypothetical protein FRC02_004687 [Tulasnella sp. 418]